jgi:hypothetical protein
MSSWLSLPKIVKETFGKATQVTQHLGYDQNMTLYIPLKQSSCGGWAALAFDSPLKFVSQAVPIICGLS